MVNGNMCEIRLKRVSNADDDFLYELLKQRNSNENISHKKFPTYSQHKKFVLSNPYSKWYIIILKEKKIGAIYLTEINEMGFHCINEFKTRKILHESIQQIINKHPKTRYLLNINPKNKLLQKYCESNKFKLVQHTYEITKEGN